MRWCAALFSLLLMGCGASAAAQPPAGPDLRDMAQWYPREAPEAGVGIYKEIDFGDARLKYCESLPGFRSFNLPSNGVLTVRVDRLSLTWEEKPPVQYELSATFYVFRDDAEAGAYKVEPGREGWEFVIPRHLLVIRRRTERREGDPEHPFRYERVYDVSDGTEARLRAEPDVAEVRRQGPVLVSYHVRDLWEEWEIRDRSRRLTDEYTIKRDIGPYRFLEASGGGGIPAGGYVSVVGFPGYGMRALCRSGWDRGGRGCLHGAGGRSSGIRTRMGTRFSVPDAGIRKTEAWSARGDGGDRSERVFPGRVPGGVAGGQSGNGRGDERTVPDRDPRRVPGKVREYCAGRLPFRPSGVDAEGMGPEVARCTWVIGRSSARCHGG